MNQETRKMILDELETITDLPSLPEIITMLEKEMDSPNSNATTIAEIVKDDLSITARLLKAANSPLFCVGAKVDDIRQAILQLGFTEVHNIVLAMSTVNIMKELNHIDYRKFWHHAITVAFSTRALAQYCKVQNNDTAFKSRAYTAGLLHDMGILVLDQYFSSLYGPVIDSLEEGGDMPLYGLEIEALGMTHGEMGGHLLKRWSLGAEIIDAVVMHHTPDLVKGDRALVNLVHIANFICTNQGIDNGIGAPSYGFSDTAWIELNLSLDDANEIIERVREEAGKTPILMALSGENP